MFLFGLLLLSACNSSGGAVLPTPSPSPSPQPTVVKSLPTPAAPGGGIVYNGLQVVMSQAEITTSYLNEYGSTREPPAGLEFLWVHINLKNIGQGEQALPAPEHFSVLNGEIEFKPIYGHRKDYPDYMALPTSLVSGQSVDAWLRSQISVGFSPTQFFWGDLPIYIWSLMP